MSEPKGWELFNASFKIGDEVIIITTDDVFDWGVLTISDSDMRGDQFSLARANHIHSTYNWEDVRFMAHDGFPVKKVMGADGSKTIEKLDTFVIQTAVRRALALEYPSKKTVQKRIISSDDGGEDSSISGDYRGDGGGGGGGSVRCGDPFDIDFASAQLYHAGNSGPGYWSRFWNELTGYHSEDHREFGYETEEVLVMDSGDGAKAHLWDLTTVYAFEVG